MKFLVGLFLLLSQYTLAQTETSAEKAIVAGNPYLLKDWAEGVVRYSSGRVVSQFRLKFDCSRNGLLLQFDNNTFSADANVKEFVLFPKGRKAGDSLLFRKGYPAGGQGTAETFYQVLVTGKCSLLQLHACDIVEVRDVLAGASRRHYEDKKLFYLLQKDTLTELPQDKEALLEIFRDNETVVQFIKEAPLKWRSASDFVQLVQQLNAGVY
ncbi:MAG: hypothetical protein P0Y53_21615 [Candidatus Pseudobacter hemicellulosilyticus]|uniref:DUF4369 domain-containing protein n=1 Tax=Candidatus Pseudobacter hemicellulosilyticus TaxID=3121375 RepID=A0AAJ5WNC1_9BACT|nr:MAG: hypothetical protein P0Y53_21615 [Pseudobacter sp.]